ncbi:hypothetical protein CA598_31605, partial [Paenibacillus sp. VTT E-133291]
IVGSSINVGNGMFTVTSGGIMSAVDGNFSGRISASTITGGTVTGAKIQTSDSVYPRVVIDPTSVAFGVYSSADNGIQIPAFDNGLSKIIFNAGGGRQSTLYNSPSSGLTISGDPDVTLSGTNIRLSTSSSGQVILAGWGRLYNGATTLADELAAIWSELNRKSNIGHTHTVTLQNHNHGSTTLTPSGGGTFPVS